MTIPTLITEQLARNFSRGLQILGIIIVLVLAWRLLRSGLTRLQEHLLKKTRRENESVTEASKRLETITKLLRRASDISILLLGAFLILERLGVPLSPLMAGAGALGVALGFGAQTLVKDVIAGFFMIFENQVRLGDIVTLNGTSGLVEAVNFRTTVVRDISGTVHIFPNGSLSTISNQTREWSAYVFEVSVSYQCDLEHAMQVIKSVGEEVRKDTTLGPKTVADLEVFGVDRFEDSSIVIKARFKTLPGFQFEVGRGYNIRLKKAFDREGIEIPFPQRVIHTKQI